MAKYIVRPSKEALGKIAENQPELLNLLVAYFIFEWRVLSMKRPAIGKDQLRVLRLVPDYVGMWTDVDRDGVDVAMHYLLRSPERRSVDGPGYVTEFLDGCV